MTRLCRHRVVLACMMCVVAIASACRARRPHVDTPASPAAARPAEPTDRVAAPPAPPPLPAPPAPPVAVDPSDEAACALIAEPGEAITTVGLGERVDQGNAPYPTNDSERLLFGHVYETLVRVDCHGHAGASLAASWRLYADGRTWIVTLREDARFSDGTRLTAGDVRASWSAAGAGDELRPRVSGLVQSVAVVDERTLAVTLHRQSADAPIALAHTDLAIARPAAGSAWPLGTRADRATPRQDASVGGGTVIAIERAAVPPLRFLVAPGDPRDLLDKNVDLLLTRDRTALDYAAALPQFRSLPLEWQRTVVLLAPGRSTRSASLPEDARNALASDAVRGEARGAAAPFWWETLLDCVVLSPQLRDRPALSPRVLYDAADVTARDVAERLVGLVRPTKTSTAPVDALLPPDRAGRTVQRTAGLAREALARARRLGNDAGYIASLDRRPLDPCRDARTLTDDVPWLDLDTIVPLVETRLRAIVRKGRAGILADWDGGLHLAGNTSR